jgi:hypothetical protein
MGKTTLVLLFAFVAAAAQTPDAATHLARAKENVASALSQIPDYTCVATAKRAVWSQHRRDFAPLDVIRYEIAQVGGRELFAWPGASRFEDRSIAEAVQSGLIADGDFALHLREVFVSGSAAIEFRGSEPLNGRPSLRWDFSVPAAKSTWVLRYGDRMFAVSSRGSFWVDPATDDLLRMEIHTLDPPADFPVQHMAHTMDYHRVRVGAHELLLPRATTLVVREAAGRRFRNSTEFDRCRQYAGESSISYDSPETGGARQSGPELITEFELPPSLQIWMRLEKAIESDTAAVGDPVTAVVERKVVHNGQTVAPKGARISGRIRLLERYDIQVGYRIGIELTDLEFPGNHAPFRGSLERWQPKPAQQTIPASGPPPNLPRVGVMYMRGSKVRLPEGMLMLWVTQPPDSPPDSL